MEFDDMVTAVMLGYQLDTFNDHVKLVCNRCNQGWFQRFEDGHRADELLIAAVSHYDKVHVEKLKRCKYVGSQEAWPYAKRCDKVREKDGDYCAECKAHVESK